MKQDRTWVGLCSCLIWAGVLWGALPAQAQSPYTLGWGLNGDYQASPVPTNVISGCSSISAGYLHSLAVKNGRVYAWGKNDYGQSTVPVAAWSGVTNVAGGGVFSLALKTDGTVLAWGAGLVATNIPSSATGGVSQVAAGDWHALALKDGGVIAWGSNGWGQCTVPDELTNGVTAVAAGGVYSMALKNGGVQVFGIPASNDYALGIRDVPAAATSGVSAIAAGRWHALALKDGGVIAWGASYDGTNSYDDATVVPAEASNGVASISAGDLFSLAVKTDGTLVFWGSTNMVGNTPIPAYAATGVVQAAAGGGHCLTLGSMLPPRFVSYNLPAAVLSNAYSGSVTALGEPAVTYYKGSVFPTWMTLNPNTGAIGGTPPELGNQIPFSVVASNTFGKATNSYTISIVMGAPALLTTSPLPNGEVGAPYSLQFVASNSPHFSVVGGVGGGIPAGLTLSTNGLLSGTPTATYNSFFQLRATNTVGSVSSNYFITISQPTNPPVFYTESPLPSGEVGVAYASQIVASNNPSFSLLTGSLPDGLVLAAGGWITGTPVRITNAAFTVRATNVVGSTNRAYALEIFGPPEFETASPLPAGSVDVPYSQQIEAAGEPYFSVAAGSLPPGLTLATNGLLSGTPTLLGPYNFTVLATNGFGSSNRVYDLVIAQIPVFTTESPLPAGILSVPYSESIVATGNPLFSVVSGSLPGGLILGTDGLLSGTPSAVGLYTFTVRATNDYGWSNRAFDLYINTLEGPEFTLIRVTNSAVRLVWSNPVPVGQVEVWRATNITTNPVSWSNLGVQSSPWTNTAPANPSYYQLRLLIGP